MKRGLIRLSALLFAGLFYANAASALVIYDWTGECEVGCTTASATLTLTEKGPFTSPPDNDVYVDFTAEFDGVTVIGPGELEFPDFITFDPDADTINIGTFTLGFSVTALTWDFGRPAGFMASGGLSQWTLRTVPEPPALLLMIMGALLLLRKSAR